jgi:hypothetical protein
MSSDLSRLSRSTVDPPEWKAPGCCKVGGSCRCADPTAGVGDQHCCSSTCVVQPRANTRSVQASRATNHGVAAFRGEVSTTLCAPWAPSTVGPARAPILIAAVLSACPVTTAPRRPGARAHQRDHDEQHDSGFDHHRPAASAAARVFTITGAPGSRGYELVGVTAAVEADLDLMASTGALVAGEPRVGSHRTQPGVYDWASATGSCSARACGSRWSRSHDRARGTRPGDVSDSVRPTTPPRRELRTSRPSATHHSGS